MTSTLDLLFYCIPALITGLIAYYFFVQFIKNEDARRRFLLHKDHQKHTTPIRLQAYERMVLFLERIAPSKLLLRVAPNSTDKESYESMLIKSIEEEYDHNLSQQIYMSDKCWNVIKTAKNTTIQLIRKTAMSDKTDSADKLRETILNELLDKAPPSSTALAYIKKEVNDLLN
ncbi:hypothetical protein [Sinomicrobium weinanense]|uniref:Uncharacterized protein n=1 Tax=Sinomicrobium weinanense TaxID=2842200 RepID=A0A926JQ89_9FLAO|nr:hypothetical protein [Sinomicrobium weinanense]MBC9795329.1 hypothetical protein [Sinomicrobium weinanense]MBU3122956.1 hypothetical protein [Sinomicrobium weinanense]